MTASVTINGPGQIIGQETRSDGTTRYQWSFSATVNGQAGVFTFWYDNNNQGEAAEYAQVYLEENPDALGGVASTDGEPPDGSSEDGGPEDGGPEDGGPEDGGDDGDDGGGDGGGSDFGDSA